MDSEPALKRFAVFAGETYYASGGILDFVSAFDTLDDATRFAQTLPGKMLDRKGYCETVAWWHVGDMLTGQIAAKSDSDPH